MKVQFASDLHLEFSENKTFLQSNPLQPKGEILILAGDIIPLGRIDQHQDFFKFCSDHFEKTYWIAGNHEYYHSDLTGKTGHFIEEICTNTYLVNNHCVHVNHVLIALTTLWTPITTEKAWHIQNGINDYRLIKDGDQLFTPNRSTQLFLENVKFIEKAVSENEKEKCIVVTHHVPTFDHYPKEFHQSILSEAFLVNLNPLIESSSIDYWIYGHHHRNVAEFQIGNTKLMTNQLGYVKYGEQVGFKPDAIIEL